MLKRLIVILLLVAVVIVGAAELVLPGIVSKQLASGLQETFGTGESMTVKLKSFPALRMLTGHLDQVTVITANVPVDSLNLDNLSVTMTDVSVNLRDLLANKGLALTHAAGTKVVITIGETSLQTFLLDGVETLGQPGVFITSDGMEITGDLTVAGQKVRLTFGGTFAIKDEHWVNFTVSRVKVGDTAVPDSFVAAFLALVGSPEMGLDLAKFPLPLRATAVRLEPGKLIIEAESP